MSSAPNDRYSFPAIVLHWLIALLILTQFGLGWYMVDLPKGPDRHFFFSLHKSIGLTVAALALLRLLWRMIHLPPPLPAHVPQWKRTAAGATHALLYIFMFLQPVSGYISSSFSGYKTRWFGIPLPQWGWKDPPLNELFTDVHVASSIILLSLIVLHITAALTHLLVEHDGVFQRMLPRRRATREYRK